jgi:hypothetical protein
MLLTKSNPGEKIVVEGAPAISIRNGSFIEQGNLLGCSLLDTAQSSAQKLMEKVERTARDIDHSIRSRPVSWMVAFAGVGLILGLLRDRR